MKSVPQQDEEPILIYTDGASSGNPGPAGIGVLLQYKGKTRKISRYIGVSTNNIAELTAIETALSAIRRTDIPIRLHTDSAYALGLLTLNWKPKKNQELVERIKKHMTRFKRLEIIKVAGHSGVAGNEAADKLATSAITDRT
jgi:ribonuclease HI